MNEIFLYEILYKSKHVSVKRWAFEYLWVLLKLKGLLNGKSLVDDLLQAHYQGVEQGECGDYMDCPMLYRWSLPWWPCPPVLRNLVNRC